MSKEETNTEDFVIEGKVPGKFEVVPEDFVFGTEEIGKDILKFEDGLLIKARWEEVIEAIRGGALWTDYAGLNDAEVLKLNNILESEFTKPYISLNSISKKIEETLGLERSRARLIGRTEMSAVVNKARELDYTERDPEGEFKYKWVNPMDKYGDGTWRTTKQCRELVERTKNGVTMKVLKAMCKEVAEKYAEGGFRYIREFVPHINCRSSYVRVT